MQFIENTERTKYQSDDSSDCGGNPSGRIAGAGEQIRNEFRAIHTDQILNLTHHLLLNSLLLPEQTGDGDNNDEQGCKGKIV